ncbi:ADP-dependent glucokinase/phosphofructokinase [Quadrisphaera setariae]|uniref:ADP-dependent phosphofructokinase/glucokinase n=1 Tax=Quadrisphaera setariae TaxID=2593304 RepID=A0A5C8ZF31_9ACTN|nr:ADP-dependent glucokinase/phosphofructokinase [Quadrisphaera setariae]TXR55526.1 hypothetical protein FMM08_14610 [Quadrisphaera setariae]
MSSTTVEEARRVVLGLGGCLDYEVSWDSSVLADLVAEHRITSADLDATGGPAFAVVTERDLVCSILGFVRADTGGERFVDSSAVLEAFAARVERRTTVGGTCVRAALAMAVLGVPSTVHLVSIDDQVRGLIPPSVRWICSASEDTVDPHVIIQVPPGASVPLADGAVVVARRANRQIYANDPPNRSMLLSPQLGEELTGARVFGVSNFNSMQDEALLRSRLDDLLGHMASLPADALVVFEDAGYHRPALRRLVHELLLPAVDVLSMNEDELQQLVGHPVDLLDPDAVLVALRQLSGVLPERTTLVVHTGHWAAALGAHAERLRPALATANALAGTRYLHGDAFTAEHVAGVRALPRQSRAAELAAALEAASGQGSDAISCAPAAHLDTPTPTTIGLGDTFVGGLVMALADLDPVLA